MKQSFERSMDIGLDRETAWESLHDVEFLASCSSYLSDVENVEPDKHWRTALQDKVGPFRLSAPMDVRIVQESQPEYLEVHASGRDRGLGTQLNVTASVTCRQEETTTRLELSGTYDVTGRVASLGASVVRRQADSMIDEFWSNLEGRLLSRQ